MTLTLGLTTLLPLFAQDGGGAVSYSLSWFLVLFCVILGLLVALRPAHRTAEVKRPKD